MRRCCLKTVWRDISLSVFLCGEFVWKAFEVWFWDLLLLFLFEGDVWKRFEETLLVCLFFFAEDLSEKRLKFDSETCCFFPVRRRCLKAVWRNIISLFVFPREVFVWKAFGVWFWDLLFFPCSKELSRSLTVSLLPFADFPISARGVILKHDLFCRMPLENGLFVFDSLESTPLVSSCSNGEDGLLRYVSLHEALWNLASWALSGHFSISGWSSYPSKWFLSTICSFIPAGKTPTDIESKKTNGANLSFWEILSTSAANLSNSFDLLFPLLNTLVAVSSYCSLLIIDFIIFL